LGNRPWGKPWHGCGRGEGVAAIAGEAAQVFRQYANDEALSRDELPV